MKIKFSAIYEKLLDEHNDLIETARLLQMLPVNLEDLTSEFIEYDTKAGHDSYILPKKGKYLMLIFEKPHEHYLSQRNLFTTIRRWTPQKEQYYRGLVGQQLEIEIHPQSPKEAKI